MAEHESHSSTDGDLPPKTRAKADQAADTIKSEARSFADAGQQAAETGLDAGQRLSERAVDAAKTAADTNLQAGRHLANAGQEAMRKASDNAVEMWRASFDPLTHMQTELGRWFEQAWRQGLTNRLQSGPLLGEAVLSTISGAPAADLHESSQGLELVVELPGLAAKDLDLSLKGDILTLSGKRSEAEERSDGSYRLRERRLGAFRRAFALPPGLDHEHIKTRFDRGVLTVSIPRAAGETGDSGRQIPIQG